MERRGPARRVLLWTDGSSVGRALFGELVARAPAEIVLATPNARALERWCADLGPSERARVTPYRLEPRDPTAVQTAVERVELALGAPGPFRAVPHELPRAALCAGADYVDLSNRREDALETLRLERELFGWPRTGSRPIAAPAYGLTALTGALARLAARELDDVGAVRAMLAPGRAFAPGPLERGWLRLRAARSLQVVRQGLRCTVRGWSEPASFPFPEPLGPRTGRLIDGPDSLVLADLGARVIELRLDEDAFGYPGSRWLGRLKGRSPGQGAGGAPDGAALGVQLEGRFGRHPLTVRACAIGSGPDGLARLAVLPAAELATRLLGGDELGGAQALDPAQLVTAAARAGIELALERA